MAAKTKKASKATEDTTRGMPGWDVLLRDAVDKPGIISECYNMFHDYSVGNMLLAMWQCHARKIDCGPIGTYKKWLSLDRKVKPGQKAIILCMPRSWKYTAKNKETGEDEELVGMKFVYKPFWFVLSQTEGKDFEAPALPGWDLGDAITNLEIEPVAFTMADGNCMGYATGRTFAVNPLGKHQNATTMHELAHIVLGHTKEADFTDTKDRTPRDVKEMEAEATAMLVLDALGEKDHKESRGYIQSWYKGNEIPEVNARHIFTAATRILDAGRNISKQTKEDK